MRAAAALVLPVVIVVIGSCGDDDIVGGGCVYDDIPGVATVTSVYAAPPGQQGCPNDPVVVLFDFVPDDTAVTLRYTTAWPAEDVPFLGMAGNPPQEWVLDQGLLTGSLHRCTRREIMSGTCSPVVYEFPDLDYTRYQELCYAGR